MEGVLSRLRDFSCREASFEDCESVMCRDYSSKQDHNSKQDPCRGKTLDIQTALAWLRRELMEMRSQDQALIRQLMDLHEGIQELKQECVKAFEDDEEDEEEECWDSGSEAEGSVSSCSGEMSFSFSISSMSSCSSPRRPFRRGSVP